MSSPTSHPPSISARELYLLQQRAETFRVELELESQLRLQGIATLPIEWSAYLEHQRQIILDQIRIAHAPRENDMAHDAHTTHNLPPAPPPLGPTTPPTRPEPDNVRSPSPASPTIFSEDGSPSPEPHTFPGAISSTVNDHADAPASPNEHIRQSPANAMGPPPLDHENARRDNTLRNARSRSTDPRRVERAHYQPGMFNGAQSTTISGGVFYFIQGGVSSMADEMLPP